MLERSVNTDKPITLNVAYWIQFPFKLPESSPNIICGRDVFWTECHAPTRNKREYF